MLADHGRLDRLLLELTEHTVVSDAAVLLSTLERCRERGAHVAIDDAGGWATDLPAPLVDAIRRMDGTARAAEGITACMERAPTVRVPEGLLGLFLDDPGLETAVVVDVHGRPVALQTRTLAVEGREPNRRLLVVRPETSLADTAQRGDDPARAPSATTPSSAATARAATSGWSGWTAC